MTDSDVDVLTRRLDRLERGLRRWRIFGSIAWAALAAAVALILLVLFRAPDEMEVAQDSSPDSSENDVEDEVKARAFVLVDDEGRPRAALAIRPDGSPALAFTSEDGRITWKAP